MWSINLLLLLLVSVFSYTADRDGSILDKSHYGTLETPLAATSNTIKKAYRKKALQTHPDKHPGDPDATEKFKEVQNSFTLLSDPEARDQYNADLALEMCNSRNDYEQRIGQALYQSTQERKVNELFNPIYSFFFYIFSDCYR